MGRHDPGERPGARWGHTGVWTGSRMIVWGGRDGSTHLATGGTYDAGTDTRGRQPACGAPQRAVGPHGRLDGLQADRLGRLRRQRSREHRRPIYDPVDRRLDRDEHSASGPPSARCRPHGRCRPASRADRLGRLRRRVRLLRLTAADLRPRDRQLDCRRTTGRRSARPRREHAAVWTGTRDDRLGRATQGTYPAPLAAGVYDPATDSWAADERRRAPRSTRTNPTPCRVDGVTEMIVWGGRGGGRGSGMNSGGSLRPRERHTWVADLDAPRTPPRARAHPHRGLDSRTEMIVWGGRCSSDSPLQTGGRLRPLRPTAGRRPPTAGAPGRAAPTTRAVWTGTEMIVWGGYDATSPALYSGGLFDPLLAQSFFTVTPCRVVDTRWAAGPLGGPALPANTDREFVVTGRCGIPAGAQAVSVNLTATERPVARSPAAVPGRDHAARHLFAELQRGPDPSEQRRRHPRRAGGRRRPVRAALRKRRRRHRRERLLRVGWRPPGAPVGREAR